MNIINKINLIIKYISKIIFKIPISGGLGKAFNLLAYERYMHYIIWYYNWLGVNIHRHQTYISPDVYFDSADFTKITIEENCTISREVLFLVHDYSVHLPMVNIGAEFSKGQVAHFIKPIKIGSDTFIGARASILPGTTIGNNCIIGTAAVVKVNIPNNSIVLGNPGKVIMNTEIWAKGKLLKKDWIV